MYTHRNIEYCRLVILQNKQKNKLIWPYLVNCLCSLLFVFDIVYHETCCHNHVLPMWLGSASERDKNATNEASLTINLPPHGTIFFLRITPRCASV